MNVKSTWIAAAFVSAAILIPAQVDAQIRRPTTVENRTSTARQRAVIRQREARQRAEAQQRVDARRRGTIFDRDDDSDRKRSCAHLSKSDKARCKDLRKEEHRLAKLEKRRQHCLAKHETNPSHPHCEGVNGTWSVRDRLPDVIYGGDVRRPRGTVPALEANRRLLRSGL